MKRLVVHDKDSLKKATLHENYASGGLAEASKNPISPQQQQSSSSFNSRLSSFDHSHACPVNPLQILPCRYARPRRHMHVKPSVKAAAIDARMQRMTDWLAKDLGGTAEMFAHPLVVSQEPILTVGKIVSANPEGDKLIGIDAGGVLLESSRAVGGGIRVPLDLSACPEFSLFPGQIVAVEGTNPDGRCLRVKRLFQASHGPTSHVLVPREGLSQGQLGLLVATGPFCPDNSLNDEQMLDYTPLDRVLEMAGDRGVQAVILLGPFIDADNSSVKMGRLAATPEQIFEEQIISRLSAFTRTHPRVQIALVPSLRDVNHDMVFPQCILHASQRINNGQLHFLPNPAWIAMNEVVIGLSSLDSLIDLSTREVVRSGSADRIGRLCGHFIAQNSFHPQCPPAEGANIDYGMLEDLEFPILPNLLLMPSALKHFAKTVQRHPGESVLVVNPGQVCKGRAMGNLAIITVHPDATLGGEGESKPLNLGQKCRVDFVGLA